MVEREHQGWVAPVVAIGVLALTGCAGVADRRRAYPARRESHPLVAATESAARDSGCGRGLPSR
jgi:hypothetical protein